MNEWRQYKASKFKMDNQFRKFLEKIGRLSSIEWSCEKLKEKRMVKAIYSESEGRDISKIIPLLGTI